MLTTFKTILKDEFEPSRPFLYPSTHRLPIFEKIVHKVVKENSPAPFSSSPFTEYAASPNNPEELSTRSSNSFGSLQSSPYGCRVNAHLDPEELKSATRTVRVLIPPESVPATLSEISKIWSPDTLTPETSSVKCYFSDLRDAAIFIRQGRKLLFEAAFEYARDCSATSIESIAVKCEKEEHFPQLRRVMEKAGDLMEMKRLDPLTGVFKYYDLKSAKKIGELLQKFSKKVGMNAGVVAPSPAPKVEAKPAIKPAGSLAIKNVEKYSGIKKRNTTDEEKEKYKVDLDAVLRGRDSRTTIMIKNIPNKYTQKLLMDAIDKNNKDSYNFFYLPIDFKNKCNVGYAFVNFVKPAALYKFYKEFNGKKWYRFNSEKVCSIAYGRVQGFDSLVEHFKTSNVMNQMDPRLKPVIFNVNN